MLLIMRGRCLALVAISISIMVSGCSNDPIRSSPQFRLFLTINLAVTLVSLLLRFMEQVFACFVFKYMTIGHRIYLLFALYSVEPVYHSMYWTSPRGEATVYGRTLFLSVLLLIIPYLLSGVYVFLSIKYI